MTLMDILIQNAKIDDKKNLIWSDDANEKIERLFISTKESKEIYDGLQEMFNQMENQFPEYIKKVNYDNIKTAELCRSKYLG